MQKAADSVSVLRKLLRTYFEDETAKDSAVQVDKRNEISGAPRQEESEDPYALQAWIQRVYAQLVGESDLLKGHHIHPYPRLAHSCNKKRV